MMYPARGGLDLGQMREECYLKSGDLYPLGSLYSIGPTMTKYMHEEYVAIAVVWLTSVDVDCRHYAFALL